MKRLFRLLTLLVIFIFTWSCTLLEDNMTDFSFTIPIESFARSVGGLNKKYKVDCLLSGVVNESQTVYLDENQNQVSFTFEKIRIGKNVDIKVRAYELDESQNDYVLISGGLTSKKIKRRNNVINIALNPAIIITFKNSEDDQITKTQRIIANEEEYLIPNEFSSENENLVFVGWKIGQQDKVDYYDKAKIRFTDDTTLTTVFSEKQGYKIIEKLSISKDGTPTEYDKTAEIVIIPKYTQATVHMTDDSSWNDYYNGVPPEGLEDTEDSFKGVFTKGRKVTLSAYAMSAYEVTQELYEAVMNDNPSFFDGSQENKQQEFGSVCNVKTTTGETQIYRPVENVTFYDAIEFCNELTKLTMEETDCVYTISNIIKDETNSYIISIDVNIDLTKKGYRLPTEAEWEFAARGGDPTKPEWKYAYAGVQSTRDKDKFMESPFYDSALDDYAWHMYNLGGTSGTIIECTEDGYGTHQVGLKLPNTLGLYDMSGNVGEWCTDKEDLITTQHVIFISSLLSAPECDGNPVYRGGSYYGTESWAISEICCNVGYRAYPLIDKLESVGFRLVRSLVD